MTAPGSHPGAVVGRHPSRVRGTTTLLKNMMPSPVLTGAPGDSDPDMDEALRRVRQGGQGGGTR